MFYLSKLLPVFVSPLGIVLLLLAGAVLLRRWKNLAIAAAFAVVAVFSSSAVSQALMRSLEDAFPYKGVGALPEADAIVALGGNIHVPNRSRPASELTEASDRLLHALRLYRAGKAPRIVITGGSISFLGGRIAEALVGRDLLREWGVPAEAILVQDRSMNTREDALFTAEILKAAGARRILLVTSAGHLRRAAGAFAKVGLDAVAAPTDYETGWGEPDWPFTVLPDATALRRSSQALHEWLGIGVYRLRGWI